MSETPIQDRLDQWIADQAEGTLTPADAREMEKALDASPDAVNRAAISILVHRLLGHFASPSVDADKIMRALPLRPNKLISSTVADSRNNKPIIWLRWLALAASLAIVAGGVWFGLRTTGVSEPLGLRVAEVQGSGFRGQGSLVIGHSSVGESGRVAGVTASPSHQVAKAGDGRNQQPATPRELRVGDMLRQGERVVVGKGGKVGLKYDGEETKIELRDATAAAFGSEKGAKRVRLDGGKFVCAAAPQKKPFEIKTRHATVRVVGTQFSLTAEAVKTTLAVMEGKVELLQGEKILQVSAGQEGTASDEGIKIEPAKADAAEMEERAAADAWFRELLARAEAGEALDFAKFRATDTNALWFVERRTGVSYLFWNAQGGAVSQVLLDTTSAKRGVFVASLMIPPEGKLPPELTPPAEAKRIECLKGAAPPARIVDPGVVLTHRFDKHDSARGVFAGTDTKMLLPCREWDSQRGGRYSRDIQRGVWYRCVVYVDAETTHGSVEFLWKIWREGSEGISVDGSYNSGTRMPDNASSFDLLGLAARDLPVLARGVKFIPLGSDMHPSPWQKRD